MTGFGAARHGAARHRAAVRGAAGGATGVLPAHRHGALAARERRHLPLLGRADRHHRGRLAVGDAQRQHQYDADHHVGGKRQGTSSPPCGRHRPPGRRGPHEPDEGEHTMAGGADGARLGIEASTATASSGTGSRWTAAAPRRARRPVSRSARPSAPKSSATPSPPCCPPTAMRDRRAPATSAWPTPCAGSGPNPSAPPPQRRHRRRRRGRCGARAQGPSRPAEAAARRRRAGAKP